MKKTFLVIYIMLFSLAFSACNDGHENDLPQPTEVKAIEATNVGDPIKPDDGNDKLENDGGN